jgi:hypothetical protein
MDGNISSIPIKKRIMAFIDGQYLVKNAKIWG